MTDQTPTPKPPAKAWVRPLVDYTGPVLFVVAYFATHDFLKATWALVAGSGLGLALGFALERRVAPLPLLTGIAALAAGVLTLVFKNPVFVKMKPTAINLVLGLGMLGGLAAGKDPLKLLLGETLHLSDASWRKLTVRYGLFFIGLAVLNEAVWRTQSDAVWALFRMPGLPLLAVLFSFTQVPMMLKDAQAREKAREAAERTAETQGD
jgi:intracellular septation protein